MLKRTAFKTRRGRERKLSAVVALLLCAVSLIVPALAEVENTVTVTGTSLFDGSVVSQQASEQIDVEDANPAITLVKAGTPDFSTVAPAGIPNVGDTIFYTFTVENTGNVTLDNVTLSDPGLTVVGGAIGTLLPGASVTATATYAIVQGDIDAGSFTNTAEVTGDPRTGGGLTVSDSETVTIPAVPAITLAKIGNLDLGVDGDANPGDVITYAFRVENTGLTILTNVAITDTLPGVTIAGGPITLNPGDIDNSTFVGTYAITQADIDNGQVVNTASVTARSGATIIAPVTATFTVPVPQTSSIDLDKQVASTNFGGDGTPDAGETISYNFVVTNTGRTTLRNVTINDPLVARQSSISEPAVAALGLARAAADPIVTASTGVVAQHRPAALVPDLYHALNVTRRIVLLSGDPGQLLPGDRIGILHEVINSGDGPLTGITLKQVTGEVFNDSISYLAPGQVNDSSFVLVHELTLDEIVLGQIDVRAVLQAKARNQLLDVVADQPLLLAELEGYDALATAAITPASYASIAPGLSETFTGSYVLTQADIDAGTFANTAEAQGTIGNTGNAVVPDTDSETVPLPADPQIALVKSYVTNFADDASPKPAETITYTFTVTNPGNVAIGSVAVTDAPLGQGAAISFTGGDTNSNNTIEPTETWVYEATAAITQADIDAGEKRNQATVSGVSPASVAVSDLSDDDDEAQNEETVVPLAQDGGIAVVKVAAVPTTNLGADTSRVDVGDTVEYTFTVTNAGNVSLGSVFVSDPLPGLPAPALQSGDGGVAGSLEVGETWVFTSTYTLAQADIDLGRVENQATASGTPPTGPAVTDLSDDDLPTEDERTVMALPQAGSLTVVKTETAPTDANGNGITDLGDTINYTITVANTGTVTLAPIEITDVNAIPDTTTIASLSPNDPPQVFNVAHLVTAADVAAREVVNQATATGTLPDGSTVEDFSDESDPLGDDPTITPVRDISVALIKPQPQVIDTIADGVTGEGDTLRYTFEVVNTGTEDLSNIVVTDPLAAPGGVQGTILSLTAGQTDDTSLTFDYVITAADMVAGEVINQAQITAQGGPSSTLVQDDSDDADVTENDPTVTLVGTPAVSLVKIAGTPRDVNNSGATDIGDVIDYTFEVTNTGGVPLTNIRITDSKAGTVTGSPIASLAVGATNTTPLTASYTITQADINRGFVENQATVDANSIRGPVTDLSDDSSNDENDPTRTNLTQEPAIALIKTIESVTDTNGNGVNDPGDIINYAFAVTNTGNVTLSGITVTDGNADMRGGPIARLLPGKTDSRTFSATHRVTGDDAAAGRVVNSARASGRSPAGLSVSDTSDDGNLTENDPTVVQVFTAPPTVTKTANRSEIRRGETVTYTITANGLSGLRTAIRDVMPGSFNFIEGSATLNGRPFVPRQNGRVLTFSGYTPDIDGNVEIKLKLLAGATLSSGKFVNTAQVVNRDNGIVIAVGTATVEIKSEHVFDCGDVIGRVFDDRNGNGYADDGEPGLPGVNVVTVNGLIITSDEHGRFHVACADVPNFEIGSNFLMKLDLSTLPTGYVLTTENPRDVRLTRGKVTKLNFGAKRSCDVRLDLRKDAFLTDSTRLKPKWSEGLGRLSNVLQQCPGKLEIVYVCGKPHPIIEGRLAAIEDAIRNRWDRDGAPYDLTISSRSECSK